MKKNINLLLLLLVTLLATSCQKDGESINEENLIGEWKITDYRLVINFSDEDYPDTIFPHSSSVQNCEGLITVNADNTYSVKTFVEDSEACYTEGVYTEYSSGLEISGSSIRGNKSSIWAFENENLALTVEAEAGVFYTETFKITKLTDTVMEAETVINSADLDSGISLDVIENFVKLTRQ